VFILSIHSLKNTALCNSAGGSYPIAQAAFLDDVWVFEEKKGTEACAACPGAAAWSQ
jgi:hypothetical protein